jgi:hypothetical protein
MGGSFMGFKKNEKRTVFTGTTDQGELFVCDWSARSADETGSKNDTILQYWNQERNFRPVVSLDLMPFNEDIILTVYDFYFCVWKVGIEVILNIKFRLRYSPVWLRKALIRHVAAGVQVVQV